MAKNTQTGVFYYKNSKQMQKIFENIKYKDEDALLLGTSSENNFIVMWLLGEDGMRLEPDNKNLVFVKD